MGFNRAYVTITPQLEIATRRRDVYQDDQFQKGA